MKKLHSIVILSAAIFSIEGCGGSQRSNHPLPTGSASDSGQPPHAGTVTPSLLTEAECTTLFDHMFALAFADQREKAPEPKQVTEADLRDAKDQLRPEFFSQCVGASRHKFHYDCALAAQDVTTFQTCLDHPPQK